MHDVPITRPGSEFHNFLYASICQDNEGMTLTVLSAIARQDIDPWSEAARLARLPEETAVKQIKGLLDAMPRQTVACSDRLAVAARLSALLPRRAGLDLSGVLRRPAAGDESPAVFTFNWRFLCMYICLMLLMNWLITLAHTPPPPASGSNTRSDAVGMSLPAASDTKAQ
jgi:hypothetical protein